jgi:type I restriction-modification system DNA methylase subunit
LLSFALVEGKKGGQFYTPRSVVELLVEMLEPFKGRVLDPCCGVKILSGIDFRKHAL